MGITISGSRFEIADNSVLANSAHGIMINGFSTGADGLSITGNTIVGNSGAGVLIQWKPREIVKRFFADEVDRALVAREILQHADWIELDRGTPLAP